MIVRASGFRKPRPGDGRATARVGSLLAVAGWTVFAVGGHRAGGAVGGIGDDSDVKHLLAAIWLMESDVVDGILGS
jgi:hypothetical protein